MIEMYRSISRLYRMEEDVCIFCGKHENPKEERVMVELIQKHRPKAKFDPVIYSTKEGMFMRHLNGITTKVETATRKNSHD